MLIKRSKKGWGTKKRLFDTGVSGLKIQRKSEESARTIMGAIKDKQECSSGKLQKRRRKRRKVKRLFDQIKKLSPMDLV